MGTRKPTGFALIKHQDKRRDITERWISSENEYRTQFYHFETGRPPTRLTGSRMYALFLLFNQNELEVPIQL